MCCWKRRLFLIFFHVFIFYLFLSVVCMFLPFVFCRIVVETFCLLECKCGISWWWVTDVSGLPIPSVCEGPTPRNTPEERRLLLLCLSRCSSVGTTTRLRAGPSRVCFTAQQRNFSLLQNVRRNSGGHPPAVISQGFKWPGREADHSL